MSSITSHHIISRAFPLTIDIAEGEGTAVTCRETVDQVHRYFCVLLGPLEMDYVTATQKGDVGCISRESFAGYRDFQKFTRHGMDWLCKNTMFEGLEEDKEYMMERLAVFILSTFVLKCSERNSSTKTSMT